MSNINKIRILVIPSDLFGVGNFRFLEPHIELQKQFPDEFDVTIDPYPNFNDQNYIEKLKNYHIIFGNKEMCSSEKADEVFPILRAQGIKIIVDIDDHFELPSTHPHYHYAKITKFAERITTMLKKADYITTTTEFFAKEIRKYNPNVLVFPNGIDPTAKKYQIKDIPSDKVRILWAGGSSHYNDLKLLKSFFDTINDKFKDKIQTVLCGFDTRGQITETDENGQQHNRKITPMESCWYDYEKIFTSNYKYISSEYKEFLMKFKDEVYPDIISEQYHRVWTRPFTTYSLSYNYGDISLAPLDNNKFNMVKSQLKVIESGFFKKPLIASDIEPYQIDIIHGENGFLVNNKSGTKNWAYYATKLINDESFRKEMGEKLYETVKDKYDLRNISRQRAEWYRTLVK